MAGGFTRNKPQSRSPGALQGAGCLGSNCGRRQRAMRSARPRFGGAFTHFPYSPGMSVLRINQPEGTQMKLAAIAPRTISFQQARRATVASALSPRRVSCTHHRTPGAGPRSADSPRARSARPPLRRMPNKLIGRRLDISEGTVKIHVGKILGELGSRADSRRSSPRIAEGSCSPRMAPGKSTLAPRLDSPR